MRYNGAIPLPRYMILSVTPSQAKALELLVRSRIETIEDNNFQTECRTEYRALKSFYNNTFSTDEHTQDVLANMDSMNK